MANAYHNLAGFIRDLRRALGEGHELAYEFAELVLETDGLIDDGVPSRAGELEDGLPESDDGEGTGAKAPDPRRSVEAVHPGDAGMVRMAGRESGQLHLPLADSGGAGSGPADGRAPVLMGSRALRRSRLVT